MTGFLHVVHFWLNSDLSATERDAFFVALAGLAKSNNVRSCRVGRPAGTARAVVDNSYDAQLVCVFNDRAAHDAYQSPGDAVHQAFVDGFKHCWTRVLIYDSVEA